MGNRCRDLDPKHGTSNSTGLQIDSHPEARNLNSRLGAEPLRSRNINPETLNPKPPKPYLNPESSDLETLSHRRVSP